MTTKRDLSELREEFINFINEKTTAVDEKSNELVQLTEEKKQKLEESTTEFSELADEKIKSVTQEIERGIKRFTELKGEFEKLTSDSFNSKTSKLIAFDYKENADVHHKQEIFFQRVCGGSILFSILFSISVFLYWLFCVIPSSVDTEWQYLWLPVAAITSLFLFMARWAARISYRYGVEARRLNQYALDLTAMPSFFAQELLNQGDKIFQDAGKKIIQEKSAKLFGNIERFDEQHSHGPMELLWKWLTKKSVPETAPNSTTD